MKLQILLFALLLITVPTGCRFAYTNPTLSLPADANEKIAQIVNMMKSIRN